MDIVEFLRVRLDEDEALWSWAAELGLDVPVVISVADRPGAVVPESVKGAVSPRRMLREVVAKRAILGRAEKAGHEFDRCCAEDIGSTAARDATHTWLASQKAVVDLASVYADHPDYDPEWYPDYDPEWA